MTPRDALEQLATRWGVLTTYRDLNGQPTAASDGALLAALAALGAPVRSLDDVPDALAAWDEAHWSAPLEPVIVIWQGEPAHTTLRLQPDAQPPEARLVLEDGQEHPVALAVTERAAPVRIGDLDRQEVGVRLSPDPPAGVHQLWVGSHRATLIVAPTTCPERPERAWGGFIPHHALHDDDTRGVGDATTLSRLGAWLGEVGATVLGTLPLLPTFLHDNPYEPSPYAPVSRCFWGEHLVDPTATPEWAGASTARARLEAARNDGSLQRLRSGEHVDHRAVWRLQRTLLSDLAAVAWADPHRSAVLDAWADAEPERRAYAAFRAATEARGPWPTWPAAAQDGDLDVLEVDPAATRTWIYAQFCAHNQLHRLKQDLAQRGVDLYLDLPIGVHPDGFDRWRHRDIFVTGCSAGAPPDPFFTSGQDWGFPPLHPHRSRAEGHAHLRQALRVHLALAHRLRLDHVMGLYRLYWVPPGLDAKQGVYVSYPAQEFFALLCLEATRAGCQIIGENLGIVPPEVNGTLARHRIAGMYVGQFSLRADRDDPIQAPSDGDLACLNTHDTPTFSGWWRAEDLRDQVDLSWLPADRATHERLWRARVAGAVAGFAERGPLTWPDASLPQTVAAGLYLHLARSGAGIVLVNLEDLWDEARPHNVPGTWRERPNWLRRAALSLGGLRDLPAARTVATALTTARPR